MEEEKAAATDAGAEEKEGVVAAGALRLLDTVPVKEDEEEDRKDKDNSKNRYDKWGRIWFGRNAQVRVQDH